jgi:hypothetical protein
MLLHFNLTCLFVFSSLRKQRRSSSSSSPPSTNIGQIQIARHLFLYSCFTVRAAIKPPLFVLPTAESPSFSQVRVPNLCCLEILLFFSFLVHVIFVFLNM